MREDLKVSAQTSSLQSKRQHAASSNSLKQAQSTERTSGSDWYLAFLSRFFTKYSLIASSSQQLCINIAGLVIGGNACRHRILKTKATVFLGALASTDHPPATAGGADSDCVSSRFRSGRRCGNRITSRIDCLFVSSIVKRSMPIPIPAAGGIP